MASVTALTLPGQLSITSSVQAITNLTQTVRANYQEIARDAQVTEDNITKYISVAADVNSKVQPTGAGGATDDSYTLTGFGLHSDHPGGHPDSGKLAWSGAQFNLPQVSASNLQVGTITVADTVDQEGNSEVIVTQDGNNGATYSVTMNLSSDATGLMNAAMTVSGSAAECVAVEDLTVAQSVQFENDDSFTKDSADILALSLTFNNVTSFPNTVGAANTIADAVNAVRANYDGQNILQSWSATFDGIATTDSAFSTFTQAARKDIKATQDASEAVDTANPFRRNTAFVANRAASLTLNIDDINSNSISLIAATDIFMIVRQS